MKKPPTFHNSLKKKYRTIIYLILILLVGFLSCSNPKKEKNLEQKPNILLVIADDLGYAYLGCFRGDIETPNIDKLAMQGVKFSRFHTAHHHVSQ